MLVHKIETMLLKDLKPAAYNPRTITDVAKKSLAASLKRFGLVQPIVWNKRTGNVVGGHQRIAVLLEAGQTSAQVVVVDLKPEEEKALNISLNNIAGEWDYEGLQAIMKELFDFKLDLSTLGFSQNELDALLQFNPAGAAPGMTPEEKQAIFDNNAIKQIVLHFPDAQYNTVLEKLEVIMEARGLDTHTEVFLLLLTHYGKDHRRPSKDQRRRPADARRPRKR